MAHARREALLHQRRYEARIGWVKSIVRLTIIIVDYRIGYWLKVRPRLRRGELAIFDRQMTPMKRGDRHVRYQIRTGFAVEAPFMLPWSVTGRSDLGNLG